MARTKGARDQRPRPPRGDGTRREVSVVLSGPYWERATAVAQQWGCGTPGGLALELLRQAVEGEIVPKPKD